MSAQTVPVQVTSISAQLAEAVENGTPLNVAILMVESAVLAIDHGLLSEAQPIVDGLVSHFSTLAIVPSLVATLASADGRHADALQVFERLMKSNPHNDALVCVCASLKKELGAPGWRSLAQRVIDRGNDADAVGLAESLLAGPTASLNKMAVPAAKATLAGLRFAPDRS